MQTPSFDNKTMQSVVYAHIDNLLCLSYVISSYFETPLFYQNVSRYIKNNIGNEEDYVGWLTEVSKDIFREAYEVAGLEELLQSKKRVHIFGPITHASLFIRRFYKNRSREFLGLLLGALVECDHWKKNLYLARGKPRGIVDLYRQTVKTYFLCLDSSSKEDLEWTTQYHPKEWMTDFHLHHRRRLQEHHL